MKKNMKENVSVWLEPYWNIAKYGIRNVSAVETEDGLVDKTARRIESNIAERYPGIKKVEELTKDRVTFEKFELEG